MNDVAAILLAAGQSRRMGAFKPLLPFGNKTVIQSCVDYLGQSQEIVVVLGHRADEIREHLKDVTIAINPDPNSEMGASIAAGIRAVNDDAECVLIALVDHPAVPAHIVSTLIHEWQNGARIVIPTWRKRGGHPILVDLSFKSELVKLGQPGSGGLRSLFQNYPEAVHRLPVDSPFVARDMDTWDDYLALHEEAFGYPPPNPKNDQR
ncbi:MAG TPA: nucleotidyltransferase family protein [Pyrinomonadaceae bacterium]|nr:nucleotidyltransferase family protein [Pyrinomonadaceae bacterium]